MNKVKQFYESYQAEWDRLAPPLGQIEFLSTFKLIEQYFSPQGRIADIAGGPGRYTIELLRRGYRVTLIDLAEDHIATARAKISEQNLHADNLIVADARNLKSVLGQQKFDGILALGPLYHVTEQKERIEFLKSLKSFLTPTGVAIVAYLNSWGIAKSLVNDAQIFFADDEKVNKLLQENTFAGANACSGFTECYWSTPSAAMNEIETAGFEVITRIGAEGLMSGMAPILDKIAKANPTIMKNIIKLGVQTSALPQYRDATDHLHFVIR